MRHQLPARRYATLRRLLQEETSSFNDSLEETHTHTIELNLTRLVHLWNVGDFGQPPDWAKGSAGGLRKNGALRNRLSRFDCTYALLYVADGKKRTEHDDTEHKGSTESQKSGEKAIRNPTANQASRKQNLQSDLHQNCVRTNDKLAEHE